MQSMSLQSPLEPQIKESSKRTSAPSADAPLSKRAARNKAVKDAVEAKDWDTLLHLSSQPGGFQEARAVAWPFLLHATSSGSVAGVEKEILDEDIEKKLQPANPKPHRDERQVVLDTNRAFVHYPIENQQSKARRKKQLTDIILGVLERRQQLSYFQGYHDIISTLQLTLHPLLDTDEEAFRVLHACAVKISLHRARDAMGAGLEPLTGQLRILRRLLWLADPELARLIEEATPLPYWAISPLMTLYTHDLPTLELAQRVMDWILCRPPDAVIYLVATLTIEKKRRAQKLVEEGDDGMMHSFLSSLPELEADELESEDEAGRVEGTTTPVARVSGFATEAETSSTVPSLTNDSPSYSPTETPYSSGMVTPSSPETAEFASKPTVNDLPGVMTDVAGLDMGHSSFPSPPSPASSTSSLPPPIVSSSRTIGSLVPLSRILQEADKLRDKYPILHEALRFDETMGPNSMLQTWSIDPQKILGDDAAEEAVLDTDLVVLPDLDDDVFEPYSPTVRPEEKARLSMLPRLDLGTAVTIGVPLVAVMLAIASNSPTTRAGAAQAVAFAFNFVEFIWRRLRLDPLPVLDVYDQ
ncbi:hypothetical protein FRC08_011448 [Ceratobasidium sp. 394]|nr:hypothetical protein FRC08_011448 [Ceratobasidium sp. 394]